VLNLAVALALSAIIGFERQWRNRLAGLRTNSLVAIGAASFLIFESLVPDGSSPTRIAAQVVSGIGFLGAGLIFREGLSVRGLNTAATLWCSAAVGVLAGAGLALYAVVATAFVVFVNLLLRPIVSFINRQPALTPWCAPGLCPTVLRRRGRCLIRPPSRRKSSVCARCPSMTRRRLCQSVFGRPAPEHLTADLLRRMIAARSVRHP
jgi:hypothetical protein